MEYSPNISAAKQKLAAVLAELEAKRQNPFAGTALEALTDEIRQMRSVFGLSYKAIAERLSEAGVQTTEPDVSKFCSFVLTKKRSKRVPKPAPESAATVGRGSKSRATTPAT